MHGGGAARGDSPLPPGSDPSSPGAAAYAAAAAARDPFLTTPDPPPDLPSTSTTYWSTEEGQQEVGRGQKITEGTWSAAWHEARLIVRMLGSSYFSVLLLASPLGLALGFMGWGASSPSMVAPGALAVFSLNLVALIPLALLLGDVTEDLAEHYGDVVGGLLNATFGNVSLSVAE